MSVCIATLPAYAFLTSSIVQMLPDTRKTQSIRSIKFKRKRACHSSGYVMPISMDSLATTKCLDEVWSSPSFLQNGYR